MISSALFMGLLGISLSIASDNIAAHFNLSGHFQVELILQMAGALYFAFAMVNWTTKTQPVDGIYGRSITIGNLSHFLIGGLALIKAYMTSPLIGILYLAIPYFIFAILFAIVLFRPPAKSQAKRKQ